MKSLKPLLISYVLPVIAVLATAFTFEKSSNTNTLCKHEFALCTSALCVPEPGNPNKAICFCDVEEGLSMATAPCDSLKPSKDANGIRTVYSTFSPKQFNSGKKAMKCPSDTPWTWCLNKACTVDPSNSSKAICICDIVKDKGEWMTLGGNCDTSTCKTGYWSGATVQESNDSGIYMAKALGLSAPATKWCPVEN